jgi:hypothetical protein
MTILDSIPRPNRQHKGVVESLRLSLLLRQDRCARIIWKIWRAAARAALVVQNPNLAAGGRFREFQTDWHDSAKVPKSRMRNQRSKHFARVQALGLSRSPWVSFATAGELMLHLPFFGQCTSQKGKTRNSRPNISQVSKSRIRDSKWRALSCC